MSFGKRLKISMERAGISQVELAEFLGISQPAVGKWVADKSMPKMERLQAIALKLDANAEWLATGKGEMMGRMGSNVAPIIDKDGNPALIHSVPVISWTTAGEWCGVCDPLPIGAAEDFVHTTTNVGKNAYALVIRGESMLPTIQDGATVIVDPAREAVNKSIVIVRQDGEATCKRLIIDGAKRYLQPDNDRFRILDVDENTDICGVVIEAVARFV